MAQLSGRTFTRALAANAPNVERRYLRALTRAWQRTLEQAATKASKRFGLTAAADWQPPVEGSVLSVAQLAALAAALNDEIDAVWSRVVLGTINPVLAIVDISWDVAHPVPQQLVQAAAKRTGARLGDASQFILRDVLARAHEEGLSVRETSARIQAVMSEAAPWQADMLARTDLNSLSNGASKAAAAEVGLSYKTWIATLDAKTRVEHSEAHGQIVPMNDLFTVGGEDADYPGDPNLSDAMAANCRCTVAYGDTLSEAEGLLADAGGIKMGVMREKAVPVIEAGENGAPDRIVSGGEQLALGAAVIAAAQPVAFNGVAAIEGKLSDDNTLTPRVLLPEALSWPEMPLSFMVQTVTADGHDGAEVVGRVDEFARKKGTGRMRNIAMDGVFTTPRGVTEIVPMVADQTMRYVSADLGATEWAIVMRDNFEPVPDEELNFEAYENGEYALGCVAGKMKGVTLLATQAIEGAMIALTASADEQGIGIEPLTQDEVFALVASGGRWTPDPDRIFKVALPLSTQFVGEALVASADDWAPPREWFDMPELPGKMPLTVTKDGRVYGHLATWDSCHAGFLPSCVPPPRSRSNYAYFHVAELDTVEGDVVTVGKLMFSPSDGGHADRGLSASKASAYYDRTGMAAAFGRVSDGDHGIWFAGALNPTLSPEQRKEMRRELRLNPPSGDWRPINGQYELICALAVAVPGFAIPRAEVTVIASADGVVEIRDAIIASSGVFEADAQALLAASQMGIADEEAMAERKMQALAARVELGEVAE